MIYFDMDGVLAKWNSAASIEDTFRPGYFLCREEESKVSSLIHLLMSEGYAVSILSAAYAEGTAAADKRQWLKDHGVGDVPA